MSFNASAAFDKSKMNLKPKCFYLMNVIKHEFPKLWESFQAEFTALTPEHSWDFYQKLLHAYHDAKTVKPEPKKTHLKVVKAEPKKAAPKAKAKAPAKKKAPAKEKAPAKKKVTAKKPTAKKSAAKKPTAKKKVVAKKK
ncbi:MAG: hypothetical protein LW878_13220 [Proteobacteria bacterium]|jgi:hypothetical protein|nr:hypothetical protein [Pseudomonadota bacterium]